MSKLLVLIVNYNTTALLKNCVDNILNAYYDIKVVVVDNGPDYESVSSQLTDFPSISLLRQQNRGLAAGYNAGMKVYESDYILFLGTDCLPEKNTIAGMIEYMDNNPDMGITTCKLLLRNGKIDIDCHRGFPTPWASFTHFSGLEKFFPDSKVFGQYFLGFKDLDKPHEIDLCISHFMFVRREVFNQIGDWDENFFVYGEDVDFCYRVKQKGWKIMYLPQWKALHYKGVSVGVRAETKDMSKATVQTVSRMRKSSVEAMELFYKKHFVKKYNFIVNFLVFFGIFLLKLKRS